MEIVRSQEINSVSEIENLESYYDKLRSMDVKLAELYLNNLSDAKRKSAENLINVYQGLLDRYSLPGGEKKDLDDRILGYLIQGYVNFEDENSLGAFLNFSQAITAADKNNRKKALKFSLVSMLNLLRKQTFFSEDKFMPYLNHYKELASDIDDERIIELYEAGLMSKDNDKLKSQFLGYEKITLLDSLFADVGDERLLKAKYYFETALQFKLAKQFDESLLRFKRAAKISEDQPVNSYVYQSAIWQISSIFLVQGKKDSAYFEWKKSAGLSNKLRNKWYNERLGSWIYRELGKLDSAYYYLNESINTEFKFKGNEERLQSSLFAIENQTEKLKLDKLRLDNRRKTNQNYLILTVSLLAIGALTAIFLQKNSTKRRKLAEQQQLLEEQKVATLLKEQELTSIDAMIAGQEKERTKVANELHDDLGSLMATVKLHFDNVKVDEKDPAMKSAQDLLEKAYQKIRGMAHAKNSGVMANQGLLPAVQKMARAINETNALEVTVEDFGLADRMENSLELTIFRILQELVTNIIKHAQATKASIQFTQHEDKLNIIVEDNGSGFYMSAAKRTSSGMGLGTIEKRIEHLEGSFTVDSVLGKGTSILIDIPV